MNVADSLTFLYDCASPLSLKDANQPLHAAERAQFTVHMVPSKPTSKSMHGGGVAVGLQWSAYTPNAAQDAPQ